MSLGVTNGLGLGIGVVDPRDRTLEFFSILNTLKPNTAHSSTKSSSLNSLNNSPSPSPSFFPKAQITQQNEMNKAAKTIGDHISHVTAKLEDLAQLAKKSSLYADPVNEINGLVGSIKHDIDNINAEINVFGTYVQGVKNGSSNGNNNKHLEAVYTTLKSRLSETTLSFGNVLQTRQSNLKKQSNRRKIYDETKNSLSGSSNLSNFRKRAGDHHFNNPFNISLNDSKSKNNNNNNNNNQFENEDEVSSASDPLTFYEPYNTHSHLNKNNLNNNTNNLQNNNNLRKRQLKTQVNPFHNFDGSTEDNNGSDTESESSSLLSNQSLIQVPAEQDQDYLASRAVAAEEIEKTIQEVMGMYKQLVEIVNQQGETVININDNLIAAHDNVDQGYDQLLKYFNNVGNDRVLILKIFAFLIAFIIFFMLFVA